MRYILIFLFILITACGTACLDNNISNDDTMTEENDGESINDDNVVFSTDNEFFDEDEQEDEIILDNEQDNVDVDNIIEDIDDWLDDNIIEEPDTNIIDDFIEIDDFVEVDEELQPDEDGYIPVCGNGYKDLNELCDTNYESDCVQDPERSIFTGGKRRCSSDCMHIDLTDCKVKDDFIRVKKSDDVTPIYSYVLKKNALVSAYNLAHDDYEVDNACSALYKGASKLTFTDWRIIILDDTKTKYDGLCRIGSDIEKTDQGYLVDRTYEGEDELLKQECFYFNSDIDVLHKLPESLFPHETTANNYGVYTGYGVSTGIINKSTLIIDRYGFMTVYHSTSAIIKTFCVGNPHY